MEIVMFVWAKKMFFNHISNSHNTEINIDLMSILFYYPHLFS